MQVKIRPVVAPRRSCSGLLAGRADGADGDAVAGAGWRGACAAGGGEGSYKPTKRGGGGLVKVLWWQAPTLLNPHFAIGTKDQDACRIFYQPLAGWDPEGNLFPVLAADTAEQGEWRTVGGRQIGHLDAQARRQMA